jgi:SecD/SecF fusion protein
MLQIYAFRMEIDQHFIAAILTVIGYSMNDTVIVFDRVREFWLERLKVPSLIL